MTARKIIAMLLLTLAVGTAEAAVIFRVGQSGQIPGGAPGNTNLLSSLDWLQFLDGSSLHGKLSAMDMTNGVRWEHPDAKQSAQFKPSNIDSIIFEGTDRVSLKNKATCKFRFLNGDEVFGNLTGIDEKQISFNSWLGQDLHAARDSVRSIAFQGFSVTYEGPTGMADWSLEKANPLSWEFRDGAFVTTRNGVLGRDLKLPANSSIEFDIAWSGPFVLLLPIYTPVVDRCDFNSSSYILYLGGNAAGLQRVHPNGGGIMYLGSTVPAPVFAKKNRAHIELRVNKDDARFALYVDGAMLGKWRDENGFIASGTGLAFAAQMSGPMIKITNIRVSETDGKTEELNDTPGREDALFLANRDKIAGTIGKLSDEKLAFSTWQNLLQIPLQRVRQIVFAAPAKKAEVEDPWKVRVSFGGGGALSLLLDKWSEKEVSGVHPSFGRVTFDPKTVRQLQFNTQRSRDLENLPATDELPSSTGVTSQNDDVLQFENGDILFGSLQSLESKSNLRWTRSDTIQPIEFLPERLTEVRLHSRPVPAENPSKIHFYDGDEFAGTILGVDSEKVTCDSWFAGKLQLPRKMIRAITPASPPRTVAFKGPEGLEGWTMGKVTTIPDPGEWSYKDGAFYAIKSAAIARDVNLPERATIQFDLSWKGSLGVAVALYTSSLQPVNLANKENEPEFGGFYSLQLNNTYSSQLISVKKHDTGGNPTLGVVTVPAFHQKDNARVEVRVDKHRRSIALFVDGTLINRWFDVEGFAGTGTALRFVHHGTGAIKLNNILVTDWDGQYEEALAPIATNKVDVARLRNGDQVVGTLTSVHDEQVVVSTSENKKMEIPWNRVKQIEFKKSDDAVSSRTNTNTVQAYFTRGGSVSFTLEKWNDDGIVASSPNFGKVVLNPRAFERIRFKTNKADAIKVPDESTPAQ
ncbi:MAG: hypothetical protein JWM68_4593 [Verrucomicrobiales bacterium]|nr:hypothetical protein [Verrucomicrobiales bacterium]